MRDLDQARELAAALVAVGELYGRKMSVVFSDMDQPLGGAVGHANETIEAFAALRPGGRANGPGRSGGPDRGPGRPRWCASPVWSPTATRPWPGCARPGIRGRPSTPCWTWVAAQDGRLDPDREDFGLKIAPAGPGS